MITVRGNILYVYSKHALIPGATNTYADAMPSRSSFNPPSSSSSSTPSSSSSSPASSPAYPQPKPKTGPGRPPKDKESKDKDKEGRDKKRAKKANAMANGGTETGEGMHVCVTCGRTDSPEWRKGPLGPKTLCNVSGRFLGGQGGMLMVGLRVAVGQKKLDGTIEKGQKSGGSGSWRQVIK